ncbi:MAG: DinB family protein [Bacteroidota bacterium]
MTATVHRQLERLDAHRLEFCRQLEALDSHALDASPSPGAWSLAQIAEHFFRIDQGLDLTGAPSTVLGRVRSRLGSLALRGVLSLPVRIPAPPSAQAVMPSDAPSWPSVREAWTALRSSWRQALPEVPSSTIVYRHPLAGPLCRDDALAFLLAHHRHHDAQVRRTLRQLADDDLGFEVRPVKRSTVALR